MAAKKLKASDRQALLTKLTSPLKKQFGSKPPESDRGVMETLVYSVLLENTVDGPAEEAYARLMEGFHDLNEIRVSSIREIANRLTPIDDHEWKALRLRDAVQHVFEMGYTFDLDGLRKKTIDAVLSELGEIPNVTSFIKLNTLQAGLGNHVIPVDRHCRALLAWLGLIDPSDSDEQAADEVKSAVRKADGPLMSHLLRQASNHDQVLAETVPWLEAHESGDTDGEVVNTKDRIVELTDLLSGKKKATKKAAKKAAPKKKAAAKKKAAPKKKAAVKKKAVAKKKAAKK